jgi:aryl-alcohol dehydrogenase-like predicted oxidoreductase
MSEQPNMKGLSRKNIMQAVDASLKRLGMDYIDLYQFHRWDNETPIEETMGTFHEIYWRSIRGCIGDSIAKL